jgi:hypothetical protein
LLSLIYSEFGGSTIPIIVAMLLEPWLTILEETECHIGSTMKKHLIFVSHCERGGWIRIISARPATAHERKQYEEGIGS